MYIVQIKGIISDWHDVEYFKTQAEAEACMTKVIKAGRNAAFIRIIKTIE